MMRYGYFDGNSREYVIDRPDTPMSWINYLGTDTYAAIVSNNASGYAFYKSPRSGRMLRFRFNSIPMDRPGRYVYLRDEADGDYWSASWQPVGKPLDQYRTVCRHGLGYTVFESEYREIASKFRVFVPVDKPVELWEIELENLSDRAREISLFSYAEWCFWKMDQDLTNFQYILYTCRMDCRDGIIDYRMSYPPPEDPRAFMAATLPVAGFDTDREAFIGAYRHEGNPVALSNGYCSNSIAVGGNPCAALHNKIQLQPGEKKQALIIIGIGAAATFGAECRRLYSNPQAVAAEFAKVQDYWEKRLQKFGCVTPATVLDTMANLWNQYQCHTTFNWSRSASFNEAGGRDGLGYRDTNQDILGVVHSIPAEVRAKLIDLLHGQLAAGYALHHFQPLTWKQGDHNIPPEEQIYSDDHLWLLLSIPAYLKETGEMEFLDLKVAYADHGEDTVYEHMKRALEYSWSRRGPHGLLLGLAADWNDCINLKGKGESTWSTFLYYRALEEFIVLAKRCGRERDAARFGDYQREIKENLHRFAWDGRWFVRGYLDSGRKLGAQESSQSRIFINSQTWAVVSGAADPEEGTMAMDSLAAMLATEHGIVKNYPAFRDYDPEIGYITAFPAGLKENAAIFCHANTWAVIAEAMLGRGDRAFQYYLSFLPAAKNEIADLYTMEPYVYSQFITGKEHPNHFGRARNSWLTGTASWSFVALSQYILGIRADYDGLVIDPCIPPEWEGFQATRDYRGKSLRIRVENPDRVSKGVASLTVNGERIDGNLIPLRLLAERNEVTAALGK